MAESTKSDRELEDQYKGGADRILQERNDFLLPQIRDFVRDKQWLNLRPEYQRRLVWDRKKKSLLIESFLMNVPIPPVYLYEHDLNRYEVMDGQQRLNTILEFYENRFKLAGLEVWRGLNGRTYADCPPVIRKGFDRRRINAVVLLAENRSEDAESDLRVRRYVFDRLNTGGQTLNAQELRNCLYGGAFNELLIELAGTRVFNEAWGVPPYDDHITGAGHVSRELAENRLYQRMIDCEIVLRFFAFRRRTKIRGAVRQILDRCMEEYWHAPDDLVDELRERFKGALQLAVDVFGKRVFQLRGRDGRWRRSQPLYDAVMVAFDELRDHESEIRASKVRLREKLKSALAVDEAYEVVTARANTAAAIKGRIALVADLTRAVVS